MRVSSLVLLALCGCKAATQGGVDLDADGFAADVDCDDRNPGLHPGAIERCNGVDDDCDDTVDEGVLTLWFRDFDEDGFGDPNQTTQACAAVLGVVGNGNDCNDSDPQVNPSATEYCDGIDNDCRDGEAAAVDALTWYADRDRDGFGDPEAPALACEPPAEHVSDATDCDDAAAEAFPGGEERCDGIDNDCDGVSDGPDALGGTAWYEDADGDGHAGLASASVVACEAPSGFAAPRDDCDDADADVNPGAAEVCNGVDDDCDGAVDPAFLEADLDAALTGEIVLNGDAEQVWSGTDGRLRLTDASAENGAALVAAHIGGDVWTASFTAEIGGGNGGEGLAFVFLDEPDPAVKGDDAEGLGVRGLTGWAIVLDTWRNGTSDLKGDHLSLVRTDDLSEIAAGSTIPTLRGAGPRQVEVWFDQGEVVVAIDGVEHLEATVPGYTSTDLLLGLTAATSGHWDRHEIADLRIACP